MISFVCFLVEFAMCCCTCCQFCLVLSSWRTRSKSLFSLTLRSSWRTLLMSVWKTQWGTIGLFAEEHVSGHCLGTGTGSFMNTWHINAIFNDEWDTKLHDLRVGNHPQCQFWHGVGLLHYVYFGRLFIISSSIPLLPLTTIRPKLVCRTSHKSGLKYLLEVVFMSDGSVLVLSWSLV